MVTMAGIFRADIYDVLSDNNIPWDELSKCTVMVTGATGLIGSFLVHVLSEANVKYGLDMRLIAHVRNRNKVEALAREPGLEFIYGDIRRPVMMAGVTDRLDYIFHCASVTKSADMTSKPVDVTTTAAQGTLNMLELAKGNQCKSFVYLSSMEFYGQTKRRKVDERDSGYLDLSSPRSSYPESKRFCEMLCTAYAAQYEVPVKIARLAQTFGSGTPRDDTRVFAQFARSAATGGDIELHTEGKSRGNYCYTADTVRGLLTILLKGESGQAYNIANTAASVTIREMAELVATDVCDGKIKVVINIPEDIEKRGYAPDVAYTLNADKLKDLGWTPKYGLAEMYTRMITDWQERLI